MINITKIILLTLALYANPLYAAPSDDFVTTWDSNLGLGTNAGWIIIGTQGTGYNYSVDSNNDGVFEMTGLTGDTSLFIGSGPRTIRITGDFPRISLGDEDNTLKLISIDQWGTNQWTDFTLAFAEARNLVVNAQDTPDLSMCHNLSYMFFDVPNIGLGNANWNWDTFSITNMSRMFAYATTFDADIGSWTVYNVSNFSDMFLAVTLSSNNYDALLIGWNAQPLVPNQTFHAGSSKHCSAAAQTAHDNLENIYGWTISDGGTCNQAPVFTSPNGASSVENSTSVLTITTIDNESDTVTYTINGGADQNSFTLDNITGELNFNIAPDFENPSSSQTSNTYLVEIMATDDSPSPKSTLQALSVTVTDVLDTDQLDVFITTWKTDNQGSSNDTSITIPTIGSGYNYAVDWNNDGIYDESSITGDITHDYGTSGTYTIRIAGNFPRIFFNNQGDNEKILSIDQWGTNQWTSMNKAFYGAWYVVIKASDVPNLSAVNSMFRMFREAVFIGTGTGNWQWDTSHVTGLAQMFYSASSFDINLSSWNIENVTNFSGMFTNVYLSSDSYDALLISWDAQDVAQNMQVDFGYSNYCSPAAQIALYSLIDNDGWLISSLGLCNQGPEFISPTEVSIAENQNMVMTVVAQDAESLVASYGISGGADALLFSINSTSGVLIFNTEPDFETPNSSTGTNTYVVEVIATDYGSPIESTTQVITITVTDVVETAAIDLSLEIISSPSSIMAGALAEYQIQITNVGNLDATNANVIDILPVELIASTWICNSTGAATCGASGAGEINDVISIPVGSDSVTYTVSATVTSGSFSQILYQAQVLATSPEFDEDLGNNTDVVTLVNGDIVFANSFEAPIVKFVTADKSLQIDFFKLSKINMAMH